MISRKHARLTCARGAEVAYQMTGQHPLRLAGGHHPRDQGGNRTQAAGTRLRCGQTLSLQWAILNVLMFLSGLILLVLGASRLVRGASAADDPT